MTEAPQCPICTTPEPLIAKDGFECAACGHAWLPELSDEVHEVRDVNGAVLVAGDDVVVIKELKLNGKSGGVKIGTKIKSIRLVAGDHPIEGKVNGRNIMIIADKVRKA